MTPVARFEINYSQFLDEHGHVVRALPSFAQDASGLTELYRWMVLIRTYDAKAIALQRTGQLGTYAPLLGQEAIQAGIGSAMRADDVFLMTYREQGAQLMRGVKIAVAVGAIVVGGALIWLAQASRDQDQTALPPTLETSAHSGSLDADQSPVSESPPVSRITPRALAETAPAEPVVARAPVRTVIRGRCVDARNRRPLAGCTVSVGWPHQPGDDVKLQQFLKD